MDIRKLDKGQMFMKFHETDMVGFIDDVMLTFDYMARKKKIHFSFEHAMSQLKVWVDMNNFDKILMNIFSMPSSIHRSRVKLRFRFLPGAMLPVAIL